MHLETFQISSWESAVCVCVRERLRTVIITLYKIKDSQFVNWNFSRLLMNKSANLAFSDLHILG